MAGTDRSQQAQISAIAALDEPSRRRLYDYVVRQPEPVSRDEAAAALELPRSTVAFHLDRLVENDLLGVEYQRLTGRSGPGAGRPAKRHRRSDQHVAVALPQRCYDLAGTCCPELWSTPNAPATRHGRASTSTPISWARNSAKQHAAPLTTATLRTPPHRYLRHTASNRAEKAIKSRSSTAPSIPWRRNTPNSGAE